MGIQINGATDSITAIDGTIDVVSAIGNAGVLTATAFVGNITGNVTGNINHTSNLELQTGGVTRAHFNPSGHFNVAGISTFTGNADFGAGIDVTGNITATGNFVANGTMNVGSYAVFGAVVGADPGSNYYGTTNRFGGGVSISGALNIDGDIGHIGDTNTKIRFPAADTFSVETAGSERFRIDSYGNAGLGVVPRTAAGGINNDTNVYLAIGDNDTGIAQDGDGQLELWANNQEIANFNAASVTLTKDLTIPDKIIHSGDTNTFIRFPDAGDIISMTVGNYEKFKIESGDITIPSSHLLLAADGRRIKLGSASDFQISHTGTENIIQSYVGDIDYMSPNGSGHSFQVNSQERLRITSSGYIKHTGLRSGNSENKLAILTTPSYNTSEEDVALYIAENEVSSNQITFGGGTSAYNAATNIRFLTAASVNTTTGTERLRITGDGKVGINHNNPNTQLIVRAPGGSGHASAQVHSGDSSTIMNMQTVQGSEGRFGMNTNHNLAIYTNGLEKLHLSKTGSLFLKCLDTVPVNQAESGHYNSTGYNAGHVLGLMVKRSICVSDADTKGVGGIFLSHTRNVACDGTTYNMMTLHNREGTFVGDVYVGFAAGGAGVVRHYKFTCLYSASTLTSIDNASRGGKSETIVANISSSNDAHFFQVIPNMSTNETCRVSMTIVGAACGRNDGAGGDYYTVNYN